MSNTDNKQSSMSSFFKSKEIIIGIVIIIIVAVAIFYFVRKNREFSTKIDILAKKFEEQQQLLSKHDEVIGHLVGMSQRQHSILEQLSNIQDENLIPKIKSTMKQTLKPEIPNLKPKIPAVPQSKIQNFPQSKPIIQNNPSQNVSSPLKMKEPVGIATESMFKNLTAGFGNMMQNKPRKNVSFSNLPDRHFEPPVDEIDEIDEIEEESESEIENGDDLDAELEEELKELQEDKNFEEDLNNKEDIKKK
jgi:hypothetical protein